MKDMMKTTLIFILMVIVLFSVLHYIAVLNTTLAHVELAVPTVSSHYRSIEKPVETIKQNNIMNTSSSYTYRVSQINKSNNISSNETWFHGIIAAILSILATISAFIKFLIDLTIIRIPQPKINETSIDKSHVIVNPVYMLIILSVSISLSIALIILLSRKTIRLGKKYKSPARSRKPSIVPLKTMSNRLVFRDLKSAIISSFQYIYSISREKLGLNDAKTPREVALEFEKIGLANEAWLIVTAFEELRYGNRIPKWITLKDLKEAVTNIEGKITQWINQ